MHAPSSSPLLLLLALTVTGCSELSQPGEQRTSKQTQPATVSTEAAQPQAPAQAKAPQEKIRAAHLLISYRGALRVDRAVTRSKEEAAQLAAQLAPRVKTENFEELVKQYSDDPGSKIRGGDLGEFTRQGMVKPFSDAAFALRPGETSGVVETAFGYHFIKRAPLVRLV